MSVSMMGDRLSSWDWGLQQFGPLLRLTYRSGWNHRGFQHRWEFELQDGRLVCRKADEVPGLVVGV